MARQPLLAFWGVKSTRLILANEVNFLVVYAKCKGHISQSHLYLLILSGVYSFISLNSKIQDVLSFYSLTLENVNTLRNRQGIYIRQGFSSFPILKRKP